MLQELKFQLSTAILTILTVAAAVSAGINFQQQFRFHLPDDGVTWVDQTGPDGRLECRLCASRPIAAPTTPASGPATFSGKSMALPIEKALYVPQALATIGVWNKADYLVERGGVEFKTKRDYRGSAARSGRDVSIPGWASAT